jgi:hypothetical protein
MIAVDTNILVYSHREDSGFFRKASDALKNLAETGNQWAIPWPCIHEFFAIVTHKKIYDPPTPIDDAIEQIDCWLENPALFLLSERTDAYWEWLKNSIRSGMIHGPRIHDARIISICMEHGVDILWSADRDFSRFTGLRIVNPLLADSDA